MADLTIQSGGLRPLDGSITRPGQAASAASLSDAVKIATSGKVEKTGAADDKCAALVVAVEGGKSSAAADDAVTLLTFGRVAGFSGLTPGTLIYLSANAGKLADSGTVAVGYAETDEIAVFMPGVTNAAS